MRNLIRCLNKSYLLIIAALLFTAGTISAQAIDEGFEETIWNSLNGTSGQVIITNTSASSIMTYVTTNATTTNKLSTNTCPNSGTWWYSRAGTNTVAATYTKTDKVYSVTNSVKLSSSGYVITPVTKAAVVAVTFWASGPLTVGIATDPSIGQPTYSSGNPIPFSYGSSVFGTTSGTMQPYSFTSSFTGPCRVGFFNNSGNSVYLDDIMVYLPTGTPPSVTTGIATPAITSATVTGTVTPGTLPLLHSGIIWSTSPLTGTVADNSLPQTTDNPAATGAFMDTAAPLLPGTKYYAEAYVMGLDASYYYGATVSFTTKALSVPTDSTTPPTSVQSIKATVGGFIIDSGGLTVTKEVINYGTSKLALTSTASPVPNPTVGSSYSVQLNSLQPLTKYYYQACAKNSLGSGCGNIDSFTTAAPVPTLSAIPNIINFGDIIFNSTSPILSYTLTGSDLNPGPVTVTLSPTSGYLLSTSSTFKTSSTTLTLNPVGGKLKQVIYVKLLTNTYGSFTNTVTHSGGGVAAQDADTVNITGNIVPAPNQLSNMGTDFWVGYGCEEQMKGAPSGGTYGLLLYVATGAQPATVTVSIPGLPTAVGFPVSYTIPANTVQIVQGFPMGNPASTNGTNVGGAPDCRLYATGTTSNAIHVTSNGVPVALFLYDYATNNSAGGSMVFPTNTWNSSYLVQAMGGQSNTGVPSSYFFVIANQDNTVVTFTPSNNIADSLDAPIIFKGPGGTVGGGGTGVAYNKNTPYTVTLNAGQIFNAMGYVATGGVSGNGIAVDLTGTEVSTTCDKKIAVFGGNSRCLIGNTDCVMPTTANSGSDNLVQQMFPKVAWGTYYLTVPTKTMEDNLYRIMVSDPTTNVWWNIPKTTAHTAANALPKASMIAAGTGGYYEVTSHIVNKVESDKPVTVTQFIVAGACSSGGSISALGNNGSGDPEMILLSPVQQAINSATVYTSDFKDGKPGGTYINVVIPHSGVASFKLDGKNIGIDTGLSSYTANSYGTAPLITMANAFKQDVQDTSYYWAKFHVSYPAVHTMSSSVPFNAIAYGVAGGESWGYNAGTAVYNLSSVLVDNNPYGTDTSSTVVRTCKNNPVTLKIALPFLPSQVDSIVWSTPTNANINHSDTAFTGPLMPDPSHPGKFLADTSGTIVVNGETFYIYTSQVSLQFSDFGFYPITATAHGTFVSDCPGVNTNTIYVQVSRDNINFTATPAGCGSKNVTFLDSSEAMPGTIIKQWNWDLGDGTPGAIYSTTDSTKKNPPVEPYAYPALSQYWAKLTTINSVGCFSTDSVYVDLTFNIKVGYSVDRDSVCPGSTINFTDTSSSNAASWAWNFGDPTSGALNTSTTQNPSHIYASPGTYTVTLQVFTAGGCPSKVFSYTVYVAPLPKPSFTFKGVCLPGSTLFTNTSDFATGLTPYTYVWNFGEPSSGLLDTSSALNGIHTYTAPVPVGGYSVKLIVTDSLGCVDSISNPVTTIYDKPVASFTISKAVACKGDKITLTNTSTANNQTISSIYWDYGDGTNLSGNVTPTIHEYDSIGILTARIAVVSSPGGCLSDTITKTISVNPLPVPSFILPGSCLSPGALTFTDNSTIDNTVYPTGRTLTGWSWNFGDSYDATGSNAQNGTHTFTNPNPATYKVIEQVTSSDGCIASDTLNFTIVGSKPMPYFYVNHIDSLCNGQAVTITDTSRIKVGTIGRVDVQWDITDPTTIVTVANPGNGSAGASTNYSHTYPAIGTYTIKLTAYTGNGTGCDSSVTLLTPITVYPNPTVGFIVPGSCLGSGFVTFTDTSSITPDDGSNKPFTYNWVYDPNTIGATGNTVNGTYTYTTPNTYNVSQKVTTQHGCTNTFTHPFVIAGTKPKPYFVINKIDSLCDKTAVTLVDTSSISVGTIGRVDIQWDVVGNSPVITTMLPSRGGSYSYTYPSSGSYTVKLIAYAGTTPGCEDSISSPTPIVVNPLPVPAFSLPSSCLVGNNNAVFFTDNSTISSNQALHYSWNFGDPLHLPNTDNATNGSHIFKDTGNYTITDTVTSIVGCTANVSQVFNVAGSKPIPFFSVANSSNLCSKVPVTITDSSRLSVGIIKKVEIYWNYTVGASIPDTTDNTPSNGLAGTFKNYTHSYPVSGSDVTYNIRLVAYSGTTCSQDIIVPITVHGNPSISFIAIPDVCFNGSAFNIANYVTELNHLGGAFVFTSTTAPLAITGNFFDPTKTAGPNSYRILATNTTAFTCWDTASQPVKVLALPIAIPTASYPLCVNGAITFTDNSNANGGIINSQKWVINSQVFTGTPVTYTYPSSVYDTVKLVVGISAGCYSDTGKLPVFINPLPNVNFSVPSSICLPVGAAQFIDASTLPGTVQPLFTYLWNFGDAGSTPNNPNISISQNPTHDFTTAANYSIKLQVTSAAGCESSLTKQILASQIHPAPVASMSVVPLTVNGAQVCLGDSISFTDNSAGGNITKSIWYFGDGIIDSSFAEFHTYATATSYVAYHAVIDNNGCESVNNPSVAVLVDALPIVNAGYDKYVVVGDSVVLNEVSVIANDFTNWWTTTPYNLYLNDTAILNPVFTPAVSGIYPYTLHVKTKAGCTGSDDINLVALDPPKIPNTFSPNGDGIHDTWDISSLAKYPGVTVKVFNRYGQLVYNVIGYAKPWDGTYNGAPLPIGTYYYIISPKNGLKDITGSITILR